MSQSQQVNWCGSYQNKKENNKIEKEKKREFKVRRQEKAWKINKKDDRSRDR